MATDTDPDATNAAPPSADAEPWNAASLAAAKDERLPFPPVNRRFSVKLHKSLRRPLRKLDKDAVRLVERLAATTATRRRMSIGGAVLLNFLMLLVLAIYGRVHIYVPNKPAESISVVYVDLPASLPVVDLRDPEIAPEPEPAPVEPELSPEPEPEPLPEPERPEPPPPEAEPEPELDLTPEPEFSRPIEAESAPFIPDLSASEPVQASEAPLKGDLVVTGEQAPAEEAPPLVSDEAHSRQAEEDAGADEEEDERPGQGEVAAGRNEAREQAPVAASEIGRPNDDRTGDDMFDEEPVFSGRRMTLPSVDLPKGESNSLPGASGVVAIYCPDEFTDKEKIAECAGRPEIRSGWRPGSSGEDFSKAASILKDRRRHGDFSNDDVTFGPELARQAEERRRLEDLEDQRSSQSDLHGKGAGGSDPAAGTRPDFSTPGVEPGWTRRDDPLVDKKDVEKLQRELEEAEERKSPQ